MINNETFSLSSRKIDPSKSKDREILETSADSFIRGEVKGRTGGLCMGIHAPWSKGKTLTLTFIAKRRNESEGIGVLANFKIKQVSPFSFLKDVEQIININGEIVAIDEIRRYMDSYMSRGQKARFISNLTADLGKQSCDFYYADQHYNAAPPRVKINLSLLGEPDFDEESGWVTLYLYQSIEDYIMKNPFFYFGFYGPDYWKYYDTSIKVEDYKLKFHVDKFATIFLDWLEKQKWYKGGQITRNIISLWNQADGMEMTASELGAIFTIIKIQEKQSEEEEKLREALNAKKRPR